MYHRRARKGSTHAMPRLALRFPQLSGVTLRAAVLPLLCICLVGGQGIFVAVQGRGVSVILAASLCIGGTLGASLVGYEKLACWIGALLNQSQRRPVTAFILFFFYVIGYLLLTSCLVSSPLAWLLRYLGFSQELINVVGVQTANAALLLALAVWLHRFVFLSSSMK